MQFESAYPNFGHSVSVNPLGLLLRTPYIHIIVFLAVVLSLGMFQSFLYGPEGAGSKDGILALQVPWAAIYAITLIWSVMHLRIVSSLAFQSKLLLLVPIYAFLSCFWAQDQGPVLRRSVALFCTYALGATIAITCDLRLQLKITCLAILTAAFLSYIIQIAAPGFVPVIEEHNKTWNGVFDHKNTMARLMVLGTLAFVCLPPRNRREKLFRRVGVMAAVGLVILSRSATGILVLGLLLVCFIVVKQIHRNLRQLALIFIGGGISIWMITLAASGDPAYFLKLTGKDTTASGRTYIWLAALASIEKRPLTGYGFHAFWRENTESLSARAFIPNHTFEVTQSHNGYVETLLQLGVLGLTALVFSIAQMFFGSLKCYHREGAREYLWPVMVTFFLLFYNLSESTVMIENTTVWILFTAAAFRLSFERLTAQSQFTAAGPHQRLKAFFGLVMSAQFGQRI